MTIETKKHSILIVDDEATNLRLLGELLKSTYHLYFAKDGQHAIDLAQKNIPDLVLLDVMMPDIDGFAVCQELKKNNDTKDIPIIFITAATDLKQEETGFEVGGVDYIAKPIKRTIALARIKTQLELKTLRDELLNHNNILEEKVQARTREITTALNDSIAMLVRASKYKDNDTGEHVWRMSAYSNALASSLGLTSEDCKNILLAAPMHDVGKIGIPDDVLLKPSRLNAEEWSIMKHHPQIGAQILSSSGFPLLDLAAKIALTHHEKWDGTGYPKGLKKEDIPLCGRIVSVCDVFDALTMKRPYKPEWPVEDAINYIKDQSGSHFDPHIVKHFTKISPTIVALKNQYQD